MHMAGADEASAPEGSFRFWLHNGVTAYPASMVDAVFHH